MTNRAALYLRSSKDRSDVSIDAQRRGLHEFAVAHNLVVVDEFADAVESGKDDDRPAFQRLIAALKQATRGWEHVLVLDTSRIARRRMISMLFEADCKKHGVQLVYKSLPESDPATDMVLRTVMQAFDEYHSLVSRAKGLAGMAENVRQGWRAGGKAPRGYALEYHPTGAIRDGAPVLKSRLVVDEAVAGAVRGYLLLRAQGIPRGAAIARLQLQWPASSTHSMDWQALTYAGHTVWNMHAERSGGATADSVKRRPRSDWMVQRATHPSLISDTEAEAILAQQERALQGRRNRESPLLLTGLLTAPGGGAWHSDGCGHYRLAKGRKVAATRLEPAVLGLLTSELDSDHAAARVHARLANIAGAEEVDGRRLAGLERRISTLTGQIGRTVDLAAQMEDAAPVLRRVKDLEAQRAGLVDELRGLRARQGQAAIAVNVTTAQIRAALRLSVDEISSAAADSERRAAAKQMLAAVIERIVLDPLSLIFRMHLVVRAGDKVASPRSSELTPVDRWEAQGAILNKRRAA